jgi:hypothetical protein
LPARWGAKFGQPPPPFDFNLGFAALTSYRLGAPPPGGILQGLNCHFHQLIVIDVIIDKIAARKAAAGSLPHFFAPPLASASAARLVPHRFAPKN